MASFSVRMSVHASSRSHPHCLPACQHIIAHTRVCKSSCKPSCHSFRCLRRCYVTGHVHIGAGVNPPPVVRVQVKQQPYAPGAEVGVHGQFLGVVDARRCVPTPCCSGWLPPMVSDGIPLARREFWNPPCRHPTTRSIAGTRRPTRGSFGALLLILGFSSSVSSRG